MSKPVTSALSRLVNFAIAHRLVEEEDRAYTLNALLDILKLDAPEPCAPGEDALPKTATPILSEIVDWAVARGLTGDSAAQRELFSVRLMGAVTPSPALVRRQFEALYRAEGPKAATAWFYQLCRATDYIRVDHIAKNVRFFAPSPAGQLEITINLSKPEKDPRDIIAQKNAPQAGYPKCMLCVENPGYAGRLNFPARQNHRMIPLTLDGGRWYFQYSPYLYYPEHCIVLSAEHTPMHMTEASFRRLFDFVDQFPDYFLGANADLPIVGGSILSHDHFQGGCYRFPMDQARPLARLDTGRAGISGCVLDWPMTALRFESSDRASLTQLAVTLMEAWRTHSDPALQILARTDAPHNAVTPIVRRIPSGYQLNLVLRNNRTTPEHPLGLFHPHAGLHHIKKENIGLIEVMGLFILPGRLLAELTQLSAYLTGERPLSDAPAEGEALAQHYAWVCEIAGRTGCALSKEAAWSAIEQALAVKCAQVLDDAGVYKRTPEGLSGLMRFLSGIGMKAQGN